MEQSRTTSGSDGPPERGNARRGLLVGFLVALLVLVGGSFFVLRSPAQYQATATVVVLPDKGIARDAVAGYYDTLSRGQIVATFAEILRVQEYPDGSRSGSASPGRATVSVQVVPDTAIIQITGTAATEAAAAEAADAVLPSTATYLDQLASPYRATRVHAAQGTAQRSDPGLVPLLAVVVLVAFGSGLATQQAARHLAVASRSATAAPLPRHARGHPDRANEEGQRGADQEGVVATIETRAEDPAPSTAAR